MTTKKGQIAKVQRGKRAEEQRERGEEREKGEIKESRIYIIFNILLQY